MHLSRGLILVVGSVAAFVSAQAFTRVPALPQPATQLSGYHSSQLFGDRVARQSSDSSAGPFVLEESSLQERAAKTIRSDSPSSAETHVSPPAAATPLTDSSTPAFAVANESVEPKQVSASITPAKLPTLENQELETDAYVGESHHDVKDAPADPMEGFQASPSEHRAATAKPEPTAPTTGPVVTQMPDAVYSAQSSGNLSLPPQDVVVVQGSSQCGTSLQSVINAAPSGSTLNLLGCTYSSPAITVSKPLTIIGPKVTFPTGNRWGDGVAITSDGVTLDRWTITGGGNVVSIYGRSNVRIANSTFSGQIGSAFAIWGEGRGSNNVVIEGNRINPGNTYQVSPISGRASEDCSVRSHDLTIRNNFMDQGTGSAGWFGIELKCHDGVTVEGNSLKNGQVLLSLPDTDNVMVKGNVFDLRGSAYWGVEVAKAMNVTVQGNTFIGDGQNGGDHAVSMNSGSKYTVVKNNTARDIRTLLDTTGDYITLQDNCVTNVLRLTEYEHAAPFVQRVVSNNGEC